MSECYLILPLRRTKVGWLKYRTEICEVSEAELFYVVHRQASGHWVKVAEHDSEDRAFADAKRMAFLNHVPVCAASDIPFQDLPELSEL
jgi:hypothetical protein